MKALLPLLLLLSTAALADPSPGSYAEQPLPDQGSDGPGGLTAADVKGKHLLDANGREVGIIVGASDDGVQAVVRVPTGEKRGVPMRKLSLGNGPNTVIESGGSEADRLNRLQMGQ